MKLADKLNYIACHVQDEDIDLLEKYAKFVNPGEIIMDLGTAFAKSAGALALVAPENTVYTLDIEESHVKLKDIPPNLVFLHGDSRTFPWDKEIALLNDDCGSHLYEETKINTEHWLPLVKKGGIYIYHDYDNEEAEVKKVVQEYIKKGKFQLLEEGGVSCALRVI